MSIPALHARKLANSGVSAAGAARPLYFKNLPTAGISALTAAQIGGMYSLEMVALSANQIKAFEPQALASGLTTSVPMAQRNGQGCSAPVHTNTLVG